MLRINRVRQAFDERRPAFGVYVASASTDMVELLGFAGMDYVRIDMDGNAKDLETVQRMIHTAHAVGVTPFVRIPVPLDPDTVNRVLKMGALGIIVPRVTGADDVRKAVRAVKGAPYGERHVSPAGFSGGYGLVDPDEHAEWANKHIILSVQVETKSGVENIDDIVAEPGLDMVQSGRGDLSYDMGVPGQQYHPTVVAGEEKMVEAGLRAGKIVSVQYYPLRGGDQMDRVRSYMEKGVHCLNLGGDGDIINVWRGVLSELKGT